MAQYIEKSTLVAEIKGYISNYKEIVAKINRNDSTWVDSVSMIDAKIDVLQHVLFFIDTLEVKEVAWIVNKGFQKCKVESTLTAEDICKDVLKQYKAYKGE